MSMYVLQKLAAVAAPRPTHDQFLTYLEQTGHTVGSFSKSYNYRHDEVTGWIEKKEPIPRFVMTIINDQYNGLG